MDYYQLMGLEQTPAAGGGAATPVAQAVAAEQAAGAAYRQALAQAQAREQAAASIAPAQSLAPTPAQPAAASGAVPTTIGAAPAAAVAPAALPAQQGAGGGLATALAQIQQLDPSVRNVADLQAQPYLGPLVAYLRQGYPLADAYSLARSQLAQEQAARQQQATLNRLNGKAHLQALAPAAAPSLLPVPANVKKRYQMLLPGVSEAEIRQHYSRELRKEK